METESVVLDEMVKVLPEPDVMKVDVEGAEHLVLEGGRQFLSRRHPPIVIEFNRRSVVDAGQTAEGFLELFRSLGYEAYLLRRPWFGFHQWEGRTKVTRADRLPALCNLVLLASS
jgi:hypothetical protein